ncbi:phage holin family protein [Streptomyces sp. NPDC054796]
MTDKAIYPRAGTSRAAASAAELSEPVARVVREQFHAIEEELREEIRAQAFRRTVRLNGGAAASALYGGAALAIAIALVLALVLPGWAAFLIVAAALFALAYALRSAARGDRSGAGDGVSRTSRTSHDGAGDATGTAADATGAATTAAPAPPTTPTPGAVAPPGAVPPPGSGVPPAPTTPPPVPTETDPGTPHHRA